MLVTILIYFRLEDEIENQSKSISVLLSDAKGKTTELATKQADLDKYISLHKELQDEISILTGEFGPDKLREEFQGSFKNG